MKPKKRGPKHKENDARDRELAELRRANAKLTRRAERAEALVEVPKKSLTALGDRAADDRGVGVMNAVIEVAPRLGIVATCAAFGVPRATYYRKRAPMHGPKQRRICGARRLEQTERAEVLAVLHEPRFIDLAPAQATFQNGDLADIGHRKRRSAPIKSRHRSHGCGAISAARVGDGDVGVGVMSIVQRVANKVEVLRMQRLTGDGGLARELFYRGVKLADIDWRASDRSLYFAPLGIRIDADKHAFLLQAPEFLAALKARNARFEMSADKELFVETDNLRINVQTWEELYILNEVFILKTYGAKLREPCVVIDIGMNAGITALYFASRPDVIRVHGYEPILPTYQQALVNLKLNPDVARKIETNQFGLGGSDRELQVQYSPERRGSVGIGGLATYARDQVTAGSLRTEKLSVRKASTELARVLDAAAPHPVVLKIDCEGAEYEIFDDLAASGLLSRFHAVLCEWHNKGAEVLQAQFEAAGMQTLSVAFDPGPVGMLYGFKS